MKTFKFLTLTLGLLYSTFSFAQNGTIRGYMYEDATGDAVLFGAVVVNEIGSGTTSDLDGAYNLDIAPGTYSLTFTYLGMSDLTVNDVVVTAGEVTPLDIRLKESSTMIEEVVVTAKQMRTTEAALATIKRRSSNVIDGISSASFKKIGDSDAAGAVKRVPGVSIEGGKYVYVRGLGDRYTKSTLNGMDIPGLDPDRNSLQMDLFPTNIIDNIIVVKTFTADLPADFTGGIVDITTKDFPESKESSISLGMSYNPSMHLKSNYLSVDGGSTDFLGMDDGGRAVPTQGSDQIPTVVDVISNPDNSADYTKVIEGFDPTLAAARTSSLVDYSLGYSFGNQLNKEKFTLGYNVALTYKNSTDFYEGAVNSRYGKGNTSDIFEMDLRESQIGDIGINSVLVGGLAGFSLKTEKSKVSLKLMRLQNGESQAGFFKYVGADQGANFEADQHNIEFSERSITNALVSGRHTFQEGGLKVDWDISPTMSKITDPDIRFTRIRTDNDGYSIGTESGVPQRIWRYLNEVNFANKLNVTKEYNFRGETAKLKAGGAYTFKQRNYEIQNFAIFPGSTEVTEDPNTLFAEENLFNAENLDGLYYSPQFIPRNVNQYYADVSSYAAYVSNEFAPMDKFKAIVGLRMESYTQRYSGLTQSGQSYYKEKVLDDVDFFPSVNLIYAVKENQNLRASFSNTIARPSFKEASFSTIIDPISGRTFIGGFFPDIDVATGETVWDGNLTKTNITNLDLRYEFYQKRGQNISVSAFYKGFKNPIEIVQYVQAANNFQARNVGDGQVLGLELEFRQALGKLGTTLGEFTTSGNVTVTKSQIEMSQTEYTSRLNNARDGEEISDTRDMAGQAPYIVNGGVSYSGLENGLQFGAYYNVQGSTLQYVGIADRPDVYSKPFHSLNLSASYAFGPDNRMNAGVKVDNLLMSKRESVFQSFNAADQLFSSRAPQTTVGVSLSYKM